MTPTPPPFPSLLIPPPPHSAVPTHPPFYPYVTPCRPPCPGQSVLSALTGLTSLELYDNTFTGALAPAATAAAATGAWARLQVTLPPPLFYHSPLKSSS